MVNITNLSSGSIVILPEIEGYTTGTRFEIVSLHPGGMGVCLRLRDLADERHYALKCVRPDLLGEETSRARFHDELEVWLAASSCDGVSEAIGIVRINDVPCVLSEWMNGGDLAQVLHSLCESEKIAVILRSVRALRWVFETLGVIHRDIKPANILLNENKQAFVADWGLARPLKSSRELAQSIGKSDIGKIERPDRTSANSFMGTLVYAAPEQLLDASTVDHRADIYAIGCIMYEMEVGTPPFLGRTAEEIALKVLREPAPRLGSVFQKTVLGLERIIARCLAKDPVARFGNYRDLELAILEVARQKRFALRDCKVGERYSRNPLGRGRQAQQKHFENLPQKGGYAVADFDNLLSFFEEADNLIALNRFTEAEEILRPYCLPELSKPESGWHLGHTLEEKYAYCLQQLSNRLDDSLAIYARISPTPEKPSEFYVNYSLALLRSGRPKEALDICQRGLKYFPDDISLLGNQTIAFKALNRSDEALGSAQRRLQLRRDVHSLEEAAAIVADLRDAERDANLPRAIEFAEIQWGLIGEGLDINPNFSSLKISRIQMLRFAHAETAVLKSCQEFINKNDGHSELRQVAFAEMIDQLGRGNQFETALRMIKQGEANLSCRTVIERVQFQKWSIYATRFMIGKNDKNGSRVVIPEVVAFFLNRAEYVNAYPTMEAMILEWIGRFDEAEALFRSAVEIDWEARWRMCQMLTRMERFGEAKDWCDYFVESCPWRAEAFDALAELMRVTGKLDFSIALKAKADSLFENEMMCFRRLRQFMKVSE